MFGIEIIDASLLPAMFVALVAGLLSFLSPCVLPIVPPYLAYMSGVSMAELQSGARASRKALVTALFFVLGLSTVFLFLGFAASAFGSFFLANQQVFNWVAGAIVLLTCLSRATGMLLVSRAAVGWVTASAGVAAIVAVTLLTFLPQAYGPVGALAALAIAEMLALVVQTYGLRRSCRQPLRPPHRISSQPEGVGLSER